MTEQDALESWCPFVRVAKFGPRGGMAAVNRGAEYGENRCRGSMCMAWRWEVHVSGAGDAAGLTVSDTHGYCGLVGKP
jgi:hypothetical protein